MLDNSKKFRHVGLRNHHMIRKLRRSLICINSPQNINKRSIDSSNQSDNTIRPVPTPSIFLKIFSLPHKRSHLLELQRLEFSRNSLSDYTVGVLTVQGWVVNRRLQQVKVALAIWLIYYYYMHPLYVCIIAQNRCSPWFRI